MANNDVKQLPADDTEKLSEGTEPEKLESGDDLAMAALSQASAFKSADSDMDEAEASDQLATTLNSLQNLIEKYANQLTELNQQVREKREMMKNVFENDSQLAEVSDQLETFSTQVKERRSQLQNDPQVTKLKVEIGELNDSKKDIEESLSNYLINYHQLTNSTSFDTSDGDQWDFSIRAKIKSRKK